MDNWKASGAGARRQLVLTALIVVLGLLAAACGGDSVDDDTTATTGGSDTTAPQDSGETPTTEMDSDEPVELTMWVSREQYIPSDAFWSSFESEYPNISVSVELQPDDDLFFQLQRMADAGEPLPDLVQLDSYFAAPLFDVGVAADLSEYVDRWESEDPDGFAKQPDSLFFDHNDTVVGLATTGTMDILYYRADWFEDAGVEAPIMSWDGVLDALRAVQEQQPDITPWSMIATRGEGVNWLISFMSAAGVAFDGAIPQIDSEAGQYIIEFYQTLINEDLTTLDALAWGENEARGAWIGGRSAMMLDGIRSTNDIGAAVMEGLGISEDDWGIMLLPTSLHGDDESGQQMVATRTFHITTSSEHPYEASLVLRHQMQTENALEAAESGAIYLQNDVITSDQFSETYPFIPQDVISSVTTARTFPSADYFFEVVDVLEQFVQYVLQNPDEAPADVAAQWQAELDAISG